MASWKEKITLGGAAALFAAAGAMANEAFRSRPTDQDRKVGAATSTLMPMPTETLRPAATLTPEPSKVPPTLVPSEVPTDEPTATPVPTIVPGAINRRLADQNFYKRAGKDVQTWADILGNVAETDPKQNLFVLALTTKPEKPTDLGAFSTDPKKNQRLGHTDVVQYFDVRNVISNANTLRVSDLVTSDGKLKMGGFVGEIQAATGLTALIELAAENYEKYQDKTLTELFGDKQFVAAANLRQDRILNKRVKFLGKSKTQDQFEKMPAVLRDGQDQYTTCEQNYVETVKAKQAGERWLGKIGTHRVLHQKGQEKTYTTADTEQEVIFVPFTVWGKTSGEFIASDRDYLDLVRGLTTEETRLWKDIQAKWAAEVIFQLCAGAPAPDKKVTPVGKPESTPPILVTGTPDTRITPTPKTPEPTPTNVATNHPNTAPTWTPEAPGQMPTDVTYPTVEPTQVPPQQEVPPQPTVVTEDVFGGN